MKNNLTLKDIAFLLKVKFIAILIVCLSSYIQLSFFRDALNSKAWKQLESLWILGLCIDVYMFLFAILQTLMKKNTSLVPGIAWLLYFISMSFSGKLSFLRFETNNILLLSVLKGIEFSFLSTFHIFCMFLAGNIVNSRKKKNVKQ